MQLRRASFTLLLHLDDSPSFTSHTCLAPHVPYRGFYGRIYRPLAYCDSVSKEENADGAYRRTDRASPFSLSAKRIVIPRKGHRCLFIAAERLLFILPRGTLRGSIDEKCIKTSSI
jgi:hypothetical protein